MNNTKAEALDFILNKPPGYSDGQASQHAEEHNSNVDVDVDDPFTKIRDELRSNYVTKISCIVNAQSIELPLISEQVSSWHIKGAILFLNVVLTEESVGEYQSTRQGTIGGAKVSFEYRNGSSKPVFAHCFRGSGLSMVHNSDDGFLGMMGGSLQAVIEVPLTERNYFSKIKNDA